jgi:hypothetical protein
MSDIPPEDTELLSEEIHIPDHVAVREFDEESVALNLHSGSYYGLNSVAARMFECLGSVTTASEAIDPLAEEYGQPRELIERDLAALLRGLIERGLGFVSGARPTSRRPSGLASNHPPRSARTTRDRRGVAPRLRGAHG